ncbi:MAG: hypothetical protein CL661_10180 [Bacteroidetes bacterium]|nr:hypothetical protein [Bacteroidota bacterium]
MVIVVQININRILNVKLIFFIFKILINYLNLKNRWKDTTFFINTFNNSFSDLIFEYIQNFRHKISSIFKIKPLYLFKYRFTPDIRKITFKQAFSFQQA